MKLYRPPVVMREPSEETESKYMAELPALPGCRAWGGAAADVLGSLAAILEALDA